MAQQQHPFPHGGSRICTFPGHQGPNPLPANEEYFPVRKSGPRAGTFVGWCRTCQTLSAERYKAEGWRQGTRARQPLSEPAPRTSAARDPSRTQRSPSRTTRWVARPVSELPASRLEWACGWFERLGVPGETDDYLTAVEQWRLAWRPSEVKALIVAESHNAQLPRDDRVKICVDPKIRVQRTLPSAYVRLVYCLGYGNDKVCEPRPPENNEGTPDYWEILERIVTAVDRHPSRPLPASKPSGKSQSSSGSLSVASGWRTHLRSACTCQEQDA